MELGWYCKAYKGNLFSSATNVFESWNLLPANVNPTIFKLKEQPLANGFEITNENYIAIDISKPDEVVLSKGIYWYQLINPGVDYSMNYYWDTNLAYADANANNWRVYWGAKGGPDDTIGHEFYISPTPPGYDETLDDFGESTHGNVPSNIYSLPQFPEKRTFVEYKIKLKLANSGTTTNPYDSAQTGPGENLTDESRHVRLVLQKAERIVRQGGGYWRFTDVATSDYQYLPSEKGSDVNWMNSDVSGVVKDKEFTFTNVTFEKDEFYVFQLKCYKQNVEFYYGLILAGWKSTSLSDNQYLDNGYLSADRSSFAAQNFNENFPLYNNTSLNYHVPIMSFSGIYY
jgi:hypothetical protein